LWYNREMCKFTVFGLSLGLLSPPNTSFGGIRKVRKFLLKQSIKCSRGIWVISKVMPSWTWVSPLIWCFTPLLGCCQQSNAILLNKGMKYWDSGFNARGARTFIATVHIEGAVIGWKRSGKERRGQTQFSTKFGAKLSFMPRWSPVYFFPLFFEMWSPYVTQQGVRCRRFLILRITLL
jgi:hypothetical protein